MNFNGRTLFSPILPLIESEFGTTHARAASIFTFISLGYGLALFSSGFVSGFLGPKRTILASLVSAGCVFFVIPTIHTFSIFYPVALLLAFALGLYLPTIIPMITEYYPETDWGKAIAVHESASSLSIFAAPLIALFLLSFLSWRLIFVMIGSISFLCAISFQFAATDIYLGEKRPTFRRGLLKRRSVWIMGVLWIFCSGCVLGLYYVLPLYLVRELGMTVQHANSIFGLSRSGMVVVAIAAGFLVDRINLKNALFIVMLSTGLMTMLLATKDIRWIKPLLFVQATISGAFPPLALIAISRMFDRETRGQATGLVVTVGMVGTGVIPYLLGLTGDLVSFRLGIFLLGLCTVLASVLLRSLKELH
jgi:MFS family permease